MASRERIDDRGGAAWRRGRWRDGVVGAEESLDLSDEDAEHFFLELIHESLNAIAPVVLEKFHRMAVAFKY